MVSEATQAKEQPVGYDRDDRGFRRPSGFPLDIRAPSGTWGLTADTFDDLRRLAIRYARVSPGYAAMCDRGELLDVLHRAVQRMDADGVRPQ
jgi:hypothetical protein